MREYKLHNGKQGAAFTVRVTPRARNTEFSGIMHDGTLRIRVSAPPVKGQDNSILISFLARVLEVREDRLDVVAGEDSLDKIVSVLDMTSEEAQDRILTWMASEGD